MRRRLRLYAADGVQAERLNDPLVTGGEVESFLVSPDSQRVVYRADQNTDHVFKLHSVPLAGGAVAKLNGLLVAGGNVVTGCLISPDSGPVVYKADQDTNNVLELYTDIFQAKLKTVFESPLANAVVAGIALIRGWAFDTVSGESIASVQFFIDGVLDADATCCSTRSDGRDAFPAFPATNTLTSG